MITEKHTQEQLSKAYVIMIAGRAGVNLAGVREHDYGVDGTFIPVKILRKKRVDSGFPLDFQLKATINCDVELDHVVYDCEVDTYNSLADRAQSSGAIPILLLVLCLPNDRNSWLLIDEDKLTLQRCCYWFQITGPMVDNKAKKRIFIPRTQLFTPGALTEIISRVTAGGQP